MPDKSPAPAEGHASGFCPVSGSERLVSLDVLRGIAVLGILVMNIYAFAMPFVAYMNPFAWGGTEAHNLGTWVITHVLFDQKFMSIFSMLFGAGLILMWRRARNRRRKFGPVYYRRMFWLLLLGAAHGYLIWFGDILFHYALMGMFVFLFRRQSPRTLIVLACLMLPVAPLVSWGAGTYIAELKERAEGFEQRAAAGQTLETDEQAAIDEWNEMRAFVVPGEAELLDDLRAYKGSYGDILAHRAPFVVSFQFSGTIYFVFWRVGGLMLLGMALMKLGILSGEKSIRFYRNLALGGYAIGLPLTAWSALNAFDHAFDALYMFTVGSSINYFGSLFVAIGHVGLVMLIVRTGFLRALMGRFAAVGRMALSNYLAHSLILTTVFYGYGLNLYGEIPRTLQMAFVAGIIGLQLLWSPWWLARFRFGPLEWLWRSLTYRRLQPMRA